MRVDEIFINRSPGETRIALCSKGRLIELDIDRDDSPSVVGSIFLGRVKRMAGTVAWIDIGAIHKRLGFLDITRNPQRLTEGSAVVVQVVRDALEGVGEKKGPLLSTTIALAGSYLIYRPEKPGLEIPKKVGGQDVRALLDEALADRLTSREGATFRVAAGALALRNDDTRRVQNNLKDELERLRQRWQHIKQRASIQTPPTVLDETRATLTAILSYGGPSVRIVLNDQGFAATVHDQLQARAPGWNDMLEVIPSFDEIFAQHDIESQIAAALLPTVSLPKNASLIFESTAALTTIDINGGGQGDAFAVNLEAIPEIARQIRLRGIGGLIMVDPLRMSSRQHRQTVIASLKQALALDPVTVDVLGFTSAGLIEITRKRQGGSLAARLLAPAEKISLSADTTALMVLRAVVRSSYSQQGCLFIVRAAPAIIAALEGRLRSALTEVETRLGAPLTLVSDIGLVPDRFHIDGQKP
ncbi:MAG: ribonuclease E/G [Alphaproteobacteria bacterium]